GFVDADQVAGFYHTAHVLCSPAQYEGFGQVYAEAMACGCPVVASTAGGATEVVNDGETGFLVPPNDVAATAPAPARRLGDAALRGRMGEAGRRRVVEYFALDKFVLRLVAAYERAVERSQDSLARVRDETD